LGLQKQEKGVLSRPSEAKESLCENAASLKLLAMTMYRSVRDMTLVMTQRSLFLELLGKI